MLINDLLDCAALLHWKISPLLGIANKVVRYEKHPANLAEAWLNGHIRQPAGTGFL